MLLIGAIAYFRVQMSKKKSIYIFLIFLKSSTCQTLAIFLDEFSDISIILCKFIALSSLIHKWLYLFCSTSCTPLQVTRTLYEDSIQEYLHRYELKNYRYHKYFTLYGNKQYIIHFYIHVLFYFYIQFTDYGLQCIMSPFYDSGALCTLC